MDGTGSEGEQTIGRRQQAAAADTAEITLFASWFCPYAQRAWLALEESGANYSWVEIQPVRPISTPPPMIPHTRVEDHKRTEARLRVPKGRCVSTF